MSTFDAYAYPPSAGVASSVGTPAAVEDEPELEAEAEATADPDADPELEPEPEAEAELELEPEPDELSELSRSLTDPPSSSPQLAAIKLNTARTDMANSKYFLDFKISSIYWGIRVT